MIYLWFNLYSGGCGQVPGCLVRFWQRGHVRRPQFWFGVSQRYLKIIQKVELFCDSLRVAFCVTLLCTVITSIFNAITTGFLAGLEPLCSTVIFPWRASRGDVCWHSKADLRLRLFFFGGFGYLNPQNGGLQNTMYVLSLLSFLLPL